MSDERVETRVQTPQGEISFQEFFVKERWSRGSDWRFALPVPRTSRPAPGVLEAIAAPTAIIVCPSNPITSIGPILAVPGIRAALERSESAPMVGVSPIIGATRDFRSGAQIDERCGLEASALGVAQVL